MLSNFKLLGIFTMLTNSFIIRLYVKYGAWENNSIISTVDKKINRIYYRTIKTLRKYKRQIKNTIYYNGLSNGLLEGINNKIKVIKRISYGYRSFCNFRGKILLVFSLFSSSNTDKKPRYSKEERLAILDKRKELKLNRKNKKKTILFNIA